LFPAIRCDSMTVERFATCYTCAVAILLALCSGLVYGVSDYLGGRASRFFAPLAVTLFAEATLLVGLVIVVPITVDAWPSTETVVWSLVAGLAGSLGVLGLYDALSRGSMTVVAPTTGVVAAVLPVVVGIAIGERPGPVAMVGIVLAVAAVALIGGIVGIAHQSVSTNTMVQAVVVGAAFGLLFVAYSQVGDDGVWWPLLCARLSATPVLLGSYLVQRRRGRIPAARRDVLLPGVTIGLLVGLANALYLLSTREGLLSVVAVLVALYPASTVLLAGVIDHERASRSQRVGMVIAVVAVAAITIAG